MAEVSELAAILLAQRMNFLASPEYGAGCRIKQSAQHSQQTGFAAAVGAAYFKQGAGGKFAVETGE